MSGRKFLRSWTLMFCEKRVGPGKVFQTRPDSEQFQASESAPSTRWTVVACLWHFHLPSSQHSDIQRCFFLTLQWFLSAFLNSHSPILSSYWVLLQTNYSVCPESCFPSCWFRVWPFPWTHRCVLRHQWMQGTPGWFMCKNKISIYQTVITRIDHLWVVLFRMFNLFIYLIIY